MTRMGAVRNYSNRIIVAWFMLCSISFASPAAFAGESNAYFAINNFLWEEFEDDGSRLLKESGYLFGPGYTFWTELENHVTLRPTIELFFGSVDYDGQTQSGIPATTEVDYYGFKAEGEAGRRFSSVEGPYIEPFGGLGIRFWYRDINDGSTNTGNPTAGYTEEWLVFNARLGLRAGKKFAVNKELFAQGGVKIPIYSENTAYLSDLGGEDLTFKPGKKMSYFAEIGMRINRFKGSLFYDGLRFTKSNIIRTTDGVFIYDNWQPESLMDIYGLKAGFTF